MFLQQYAKSVFLDNLGSVVLLCRSSGKQGEDFYVGCIFDIV